MIPHNIFKPKALISPVSIHEFLVALSKSWGALDNFRVGPRTIGLAISGGVDSMALAALCLKAMSSILDNEQIQFRAFVVDHASRPSSSEESRQVVQILEDNGIRSQVLSMAWKSQARPSDLPNFESVARKLRYQLMGKACKEHGIKSLLLAHHQDDQAETILMRMIKGQRGPALAGIKSNNGIPECYGLHGIWESGGNPVTSPSSMHEGDSLPIETDGIRIYRPLLGFSKARLIATCETEHMSWFEDHTNKDPTLTTRNAIRHIYNTRQLPAALSKERLLRLAEKLVAATTCRNSLKQSYLSKCEVAGFSNRSGAITIKFPELRHADVILAAEILRHVILLITPEEHVPISSLQGSVRHIFGHIEFGKHQISPKRFNVAGVFFEPLPGPSPSLERTWLICRQPYVSSVPKPTFNVSLSLNGDRVWTNWRLWDGRFWMRLQSSDRINIVVRPFSAGDVAKFRQSLSSAAKSKLKVHFKGIAKGGIRYTLPCLVVKKNGEDIVVGLPSLDIYSENTLVKCEIRYKKIDWDGLPVVTSQEELS